MRDNPSPLMMHSPQISQYGLVHQSPPQVPKKVSSISLLWHGFCPVSTWIFVMWWIAVFVCFLRCLFALFFFCRNHSKVLQLWVALKKRSCLLHLWCVVSPSVQPWDKTLINTLRANPQCQATANRVSETPRHAKCTHVHTKHSVYTYCFYAVKKVRPDFAREWFLQFLITKKSLYGTDVNEVLL